jgi:hypothetical protein
MIMANKNILRFDSGSSPYCGFFIEQEHAPPDKPHPHERDPETGAIIETPPKHDGWLSTVVRKRTETSEEQRRGPFVFTGDAVEEMKRWAAELAADSVRCTLARNITDVAQGNVAVGGPIEPSEEC